MSKNTGKILAGLAAFGAAAAGAYYYFKKKTEDDFEDEFNEDFDAEEFELDDDLREAGERGYVSLTPNKEANSVEKQAEDEASETPAPEAEADKTKETADNEDACSSEKSCCSDSSCSSEEGCCCSDDSCCSEGSCCCSGSTDASSEETEEKTEE